MVMVMITMDEDEDEWYDSWTEEIRKEEKDDDAKMLFLKIGQW